MADTIYIYALRCPVEGKIRYVGQSRDVESRVANHMSETKNAPKNQWLAALKNQHLMPQIEILDSVEVEADPATVLERAWIKRLLENGEPLTNSRTGPRGLEHISASHLRTLRQRKLWLIGDLERESGVHRNVISKLENERGGAHPETLRKLASALDIEPRELVK